MSSLKKMDVFYRNRKVGTLAETKDRRIAFEYDGAWLGSGFSISPFSLPLEKKVFLSKAEPFDGLLECLPTACPMAGGGFWWTGCFCGSISTPTR